MLYSLGGWVGGKKKKKKKKNLYLLDLCLEFSFSLLLESFSFLCEWVGGWVGGGRTYLLDLCLELSLPFLFESFSFLCESHLFRPFSLVSLNSSF